MTRTFCLSLTLTLAAMLSQAGGQQPVATATPAKRDGITVTMKDGPDVQASALRFQDGVLLATQPVANGIGEIGYPLASIERVHFPEPSETRAAATLLADNKPTAALAKIEPIVAYYAPFRSVPGNWWLPAARIKLNALGMLKREREVDTLVGELSKLADHPDALEAARVAAAEALVRRNLSDKAEAICDEITKSGTDDDALARAWLCKGHILLSKGDNDGAVLAYLHIPVFYPDNRLLMPPALFGSGEAFVQLDERPHALEMFQHLVTDYPTSAEAITGKSKLREIERSIALANH